MTNNFNLFREIPQVWDRMSHNEDDTVSVLLDNQDLSSIKSLISLYLSQKLSGNGMNYRLTI